MQDFVDVKKNFLRKKTFFYESTYQEEFCSHTMILQRSIKSKINVARCREVLLILFEKMKIFNIFNKNIYLIGYF